MDFPTRARLGHEVPSWVPDGAFFFITINCIPRQANQLCRADIGEAVLAAAVSYILLNPVRWGLCEKAEDWKWVYRPNDRPPPKC
jgi:hypothetical protein